MSLAIVYYSPSAGGNHLKNLINLDPNMRDNHSLDLGIYDQSNQGTAHSRAGRNVLRSDIEAIIREPAQRWCICGHFGELAPKRDLLMQIPDRRFVIISIESTVDRWLLEARQQKLGQQCHPYWLNEEQPYLYDRPMCKEYWRTLESIKISLEHFWNPDLRAHGLVDIINDFLGTDIPKQQACDLHHRWWWSNFDRPDVRAHYGV